MSRLARWQRTWAGLLVHAVLALASALTATAAFAVEPPSAGWTFRKVFAPADSIANWPRENVHYIPVEPAEFDALVAAQHTAPDTGIQPQASRFVSASYELKFEAPDVLRGIATLQVDPAEAKADVPLAPWNLAVVTAQWTTTNTAATVGIDARGRALLRASQAGKLRVEWALRGNRNVLGGAEFNLEIPSAGQSTVVCDLPETIDLSVNVGSLSFEKASEAGQRRWHVDVGGHSQVALRIVPRESSVGSQLPEVRTQSLYELTPHGVDLTAQWRIEPGTKPVRELRAPLEEGLQLVEVTLGDKPLRWTTVQSPGAGQSVAIIELPEMTRGVHRTVRLSALGAWEIGRVWQLPRLIPEGVSWREGTSTIAIPTPLVLKQLEPTGGRLIRTGVLPAPRVGETFELQLWDPAATAQLMVARDRDRIQVAKLVELEISGDAQTARAVADLRVAAGERFGVRADVQADWVIDEVLTQPADALVDWTFDAGVDNTRQLNLRLARALNAQQPLRVIVKARRRVASLGEHVPWSLCQVVSFADAVVAEDLFTLITPGWGLDLLASGPLQQISREQLSPVQKSLAEGVEFTQLWRLDPYDSPPTLMFKPRAARMEADQHVEVVVTSDQLQESYTWKCRPIDSAIQRLQVRFSTPRTTPPHWLVNGQSGGAFRFRRVDENAGSPNALNREIWEIIFERPMRRNFTLQASRIMTSDASTPVSLAVIEPASRQTGVLVVRAAGSTPVMVQTRGLRDEFGPGQIPALPGAVSESSAALASNQESAPTSDLRLPVRAAIRFDPERDAAVSAEPRVLLVRPKLPSASVPLVVWTSHLTTHFQESGHASHVLQLLVRNNGSDSINLNLAADATGVQVSVDGQKLELRDQTTIPLNPSQALVTIVVRFTTRAPAFGPAVELSPPALEVRALVVNHRWRVWLPAGYRTIDCRNAAWLARDQEDNWSRRLFGSLSRPSHQAVFDPFSPEVWREALGLVTARDTSRTLMRDILLQLNQAFDEGQKQTPAITWGQAWAKLEALPEAQHVVWLIDRQACDELGIEPGTLVPPFKAESPEIDRVERTCRLLQQVGLVLVTDGSNALVTTAAALGHVRDETDSLIDRTVFWLEPGPLQARLAAGMAHESSRYLRVGHWQLDETPIPLVRAGLIAGAERAGDSSCELELAAEGKPALLIEQRSIASSRSWGLAFMAASLAVFFSRRWPQWAAFAVACVVASTILVPASLIGWVSPIACGAFVGVLGVWLLPRSAPSDPQRPVAAPASKSELEATRTIAMPSAIVTGVIIMLGLLAALATAAEQPAAAARREFRVFVPSDDQGKPNGGHYLVPEPLFNALKNKSKSGHGASDWLLVGTHYRATLVAGAQQRNWDLSELVGVYDFFVSSPEVTIELPLGMDAATGVRALLDGRPIDVRYDEQRQRLSFDTISQGDTRLELFLRPVLRFFSDGTGFDFAASTALNTTLDVWLPDQTPAVSSPVAIGRGQRNADGQSIRFTMGRSPQLALRWHDGRANGQSAGVATADELRWLKVRPGSVVIDARWNVRAESGALREVTLLTDSRLRPLTGTTKVDGAEANWSPVDTPVPANMRAWRLTFVRPVTEAAIIDTSFLWTDVSGVGQLQSPLLELAAARRSRRWTAIAVDASLEFDLHDAGEVIEPARFLEAWGDAATPPQRVVEWSSTAPAWRLATRPRPIEYEVQESNTISVDANRTRVWYAADLVTRGGALLQYQLTCPGALQIERVSLQEDGVDRTVHWSQNGTELALFLSEPTTGAQQLVVEGSITHAAQDSLALPLVWLGKEPRPGAKVTVYRRPSVLLSIDREHDLVKAATPARDEGLGRRGRLEFAYATTGAVPSARLIVAENQPKITVTQLTSVTADGDGWRIDIDSRWQVADGLADQLQFRLDAPEEIRWTAQPASKIEMSLAADGQMNQLTVTPPNAVPGDFRLQLRGTLPASTSRKLAVPNLYPWNVASAQRFLRAPMRKDGKPIRWELSHWQLSKSPAGFTKSDRHEQTFEAVDQATTAHLDSVPTSATPKLFLADVHVMFNDARNYFGQVAFDVETTIDSETVLRVPENCQLVQASIDGRPATLASAGTLQWRVPLGNSALPQHLEVTFRGQLPEHSWFVDRLQVAVPTLRDLESEHTLWTIVAPRNWRMDVGAAHSRGAWGLDLLRLQSLARLLDCPSDRVAALDAGQRVAWYAPWRARWQNVLARLKRELATAQANSNRQAAEGKMLAIEQELAARSAQFDNGPADTMDPQLNIDATDFWQRTIRRGHNVVRGVSSGPAGQLSLHWANLTAGETTVRWSVAICLVLFAGLAIRLRRRWAQFVSLAPFSRGLIGTLVGLVWWLWLEPSALGLTIVLVSAAASVWSFARFWSGRNWRTNQRVVRPAAAMLLGGDGK